MLNHKLPMAEVMSMRRDTIKKEKNENNESINAIKTYDENHRSHQR